MKPFNYSKRDEAFFKRTDIMDKDGRFHKCLCIADSKEDLERIAEKYRSHMINEIHLDWFRENEDGSYLITPHGEESIKKLKRNNNYESN